jgi:ankyrin repeat protein
MIRKIIDGRTDLIFDYISQGNSPLINIQGASLIKWAAYYGDVTAIKLLISEGVSFEDLGVNFDLNGAVFHGHWQLCQFLLEKGANPNYCIPENGESPLHNCLTKANSPSSEYILELLLAYKANPKCQTLPRKETGVFMRDAYTCAETPLHRAAAFGSAKVISLLLEHGADKTARDMNGNSPISWASWHLRPGKILSLLAFGENTIHPLHIERMKSDHDAGWGGGTYLNLLGQPHL